MTLDLEETLHLAIHAASVGQHHACLAYLKDVLAEQPRHTRGLYLLASQHATLGLVDRAIAELEAVLDIDPAFELAGFQRGLLLMDRREADAAAHQFNRLISSGSASMARFAEAMMACSDGRWDSARTLVQEGVRAGADNLALVDLLMALIAKGEAAAARAPDRQEATAAEPVYLGAYSQR